MVLLYTDGLYERGEKGELANWSVVKNYCLDHMEELISHKVRFMDQVLSHSSSRRPEGFTDDVALMLIQKK